jgi:thiamine biosynthesis lipoprotein
MPVTKKQTAGLVAAGVLLALTVFATWWTAGDDLDLRLARPARIMGTETELKAVAPVRRADLAGKALADAEAALRRVEALMSAHLDSSELSLINAGKEGAYPLSGELGEVLLAGRAFYDQTAGAFDVTCRPIIELWEQAGKAGIMPTERQRLEARAKSNWEQVTIEPGGRAVLKKTATACFDLGGIAKGYGIDKATEAMMKAGLVGGVVDVGGDLRCFGRPPGGQYWPVHVRNPFGEGTLATLNMQDGAVCTSGNYERYAIIRGERYSHIVDPRGGPRACMALPASSTPPSVTVIAPTAMVADAWATGLSVLGPEGLKLLPAGSGIEAMVVTGGPDNYKLHMTQGFRKFLKSEPKTSSAETEGEAGRAGGGHGP